MPVPRCVGRVPYYTIGHASRITAMEMEILEAAQLNQVPPVKKSPDFCHLPVLSQRRNAAPGRGLTLILYQKGRISANGMENGGTSCSLRAAAPGLT